MVGGAPPNPTIGGGTAQDPDSRASSPLLGGNVKKNVGAKRRGGRKQNFGLQKKGGGDASH